MPITVGAVVQRRARMVGFRLPSRHTVKSIRVGSIAWTSCCTPGA